MKKILSIIFSIFGFVAVHAMDHEPYPTEKDFGTKLHYSQMNSDTISRIGDRDRISAYEERKKKLYDAMHIAKSMGTNDLFGLKKLKKTLGTAREELDYPSSDHELECFKFGKNYKCVEYLKFLNFFNEVSKPAKYYPPGSLHGGSHFHWRDDERKL